MAQRSWVSFGVAVFLGLVGCAAPPEERAAGEGEAPPREAPPVQGPPAEEAAPGAGPELPQEEAPSGLPEALCPAANLGATPTEALVDPRPDPRLCAFSPDGCDAHRPSHARRAVPRPCRVYDPTPYSSGDYRLQHDASGRLTQFEGPHDWYEGFTYDACGRLAQYGESPIGSMSTYFDAWERTGEGQFLRWRFAQNSSEKEMTVERDAQGALLGATVVSLVFSPPYVLEKHAYTLDAQGRIARTEVISRNGEGQLTEHAWQETRRYGASGALEEIRREANGKVSWVQEFSQGRRVRFAGGDGSWETRWTYGLSGELLAYANQSQTQRLQVSYQYGEDGRLLQAAQTVWARTSEGWRESQFLSEYSYAGDGRILSRKDRMGTTTSSYVYEYACEPDASGR